MTRRKFSREFKVEAVRLVTDRGVAVAQAARDLDVAESVLRRWMRELTATPATAFPGNGQMRANLAEVGASKKEVARLRAERNILKKAVVGSTGQGNGSVKGISRRLEAKRFPRPRIEPEGHLIEVALRVYG